MVSIIGSGFAARPDISLIAWRKAVTGRMQTIRRFFRCAALAGVGAMSAAPAAAADNALLIQTDTAGKFVVWHIEGETNLTEDELMLLEASAAAEGGRSVATSYGPARAYETSDGIVIVLAEARRDGKLLLDHDACSALKTWHAEGATHLTDDQLADLVLTATADGRVAVSIGSYRARAYITKLGVMATLWKPVPRQPR